MNNIKTVLFICMVLYGSLWANNIDVKINIDAQIYGVLNKTRVDIYYTNHSTQDSMNIKNRILVNSSAIMTDLWLEIGGELRQAETLSKRSGRPECTQNKTHIVDSAYMTKEKNGAYSLSVYPVKKGETRHVVFEYYSIMESGQSFSPKWEFQNDYKAGIQLKMSGALIEGSRIKFENENYRQMKGMVIRSYENEKSVKVTMILPVNEAQDSNIYNDKTEMLCVAKPSEIRNFNVHEFSDFPALMDSIITLTDHYEIPNINNMTRDEYFTAFANYLRELDYITCNYHDEAVDWVFDRDDQNFIYIDPSFTLYTHPDRTAQRSILCPFADIFVEYLRSLDESATDSGLDFLSRDGIKTVIVDRGQGGFIDDIHPAEMKTRSPSSGELPIDTSANIFVAYDQPPAPIGGFAEIQRQVRYTKSAYEAGIEGRVVVRCLISKEGRLLDAKIVHSLNPELDQCAINAIRQVGWKPALTRDKPVSVWIAIPVVFRLGKGIKWDELPELPPFELVEIDGKMFDCVVENGEISFMERGFDPSNPEQIIYLSDAFFDFLYYNPHFLKSTYRFFQENKAFAVGIILDHKSILFQKIP